MKDKIYPTLKTPFVERMDKETPWNVYPRPQMKRDSFLCLNGPWDLEIADTNEIPRQFTKKILVPFPPESELSGIKREFSESDVLFYRRNFSLPDGFMKDRLILHFGAVDRLAKVYVNGREAALSTSGYLPFSIDVTDFLCDGENEIIVAVRDELSPLFPYGKQKRKRGGMWYTPTSGIWQTVWLESLPVDHIENIKITPSCSSVKIEVSCKAAKKKITLTESGEVFEFEGDCVTISPASIINWTPETPYLYKFKLETDTDSVESYFALREISSTLINGVKRLTLNGKPYLFNGLLDQGYFPDGIFLPATPEGYENDIRAAKSLGFNTLRKHIKIEPEIFYYLCDTIGIAVFQDMVNNGRYSFLRDTALPTVGFKHRRDKFMHKDPKSREEFIKTMTATADLLYNSPSVVYYTIFNEGWGQFDADSVYRILKSHDGTRIIDATSGWFFQKESDVDSHHVYFKKPRLKVSANRPLVLSEFGGFSHRVEGHLFGSRNYGYSSYEKREDFENAVCELYEKDIFPLVKDGISALIYTQVSDIEDETNGFLTYDRKVIKVDTERLKNISDRLFRESVETETK